MEYYSPESAIAWFVFLLSTGRLRNMAVTNKGKQMQDSWRMTKTVYQFSHCFYAILRNFLIEGHFDELQKSNTLKCESLKSLIAGTQ